MSIPKSQQGFTMLELLFSLMIIGVLAFVALPVYRGFISKTQFSIGLADISPGKTMMEVYLNEEKTITSASFIGLVTSSSNCSLIAANGNPTTGISGITCTIAGSDEVNGKIIRLNRNASGAWSCETDVDPEFYRACESGAPVALSNS